MGWDVDLDLAGRSGEYDLGLDREGIGKTARQSAAGIVRGGRSRKAQGAIGRPLVPVAAVVPLLVRPIKEGYDTAARWRGRSAGDGARS